MTDPETQDALHRLARVLAGSALVGGGARLALGAVQPASYPAAPPKPPPRVVVPLAAPAADDEPAAPPQLMLPGKRALDGDGSSYLPEWATPVTSAVHTPGWFDRLYKGVLGSPPPAQTPMTDAKAWAPVAMLGGGVAGGLGGWMLGDKLVRTHQRALADRELDRSKKDYLDAAYAGTAKAANLLMSPPPPATVTPPLAAARPLAVTPSMPPGPVTLPPVKPVPAPVLKVTPPAPAASNPPAPKPAGPSTPSTKAAVLAAALLGDPADPDLRAAKAALDAAHDGFCKRADEGLEHSLLYRALFPGTNFGPAGAAFNLGVAALAGAGGAYGGYRYARNADLERLRRDQLADAERADQADRPPVVVGELRKPPKPAPLSFSAGRLAPAAT